MLHICTQYFNEGHSYNVIVDMMSSLHDINISLQTLKSIVSQAELYCRNNYSSPNAVINQPGTAHLPTCKTEIKYDCSGRTRLVINAIRLELRGPGQLFGYQTIWQVLKQKYNLRVRRDDVMNLLRELNPRRCERRARRRFIRRTYHSMGPNYMWHADGYDQIKPFGLAISECIDGFSHKVLWLECGPTNNNPRVIAHNLL